MFCLMFGDKKTVTHCIRGQHQNIAIEIKLLIIWLILNYRQAFYETVSYLTNKYKWTNDSTLCRLKFVHKCLHSYNGDFKEYVVNGVLLKFTYLLFRFYKRENVFRNSGNTRNSAVSCFNKLLHPSTCLEFIEVFWAISYNVNQMTSCLIYKISWFYRYIFLDFINGLIFH